jgi:endonuclease/exonuclease/phosphatase family metal-dependent hydrolase
MRVRFVSLLAFGACLFGGCFGGGNDEKQAAATGASKQPEITLRVATFNIFYGGDEMVLASKDWCTDPEGCQETFAAVVDAIQQSQADIVGLQEATGNTRKVAEALGWNYNERTQVISRFPILDPGGGDGLYVFVQPTPSTVVAVSNTHLPSSPYGPYRAQAGYTPEQLVHLEERLRLPAIRPQLEGLPPLAEDGIPVFLTGDFNSPSYFDWTEVANSAREDMPYAFEWPVSKALADAGFEDSFRVVNPDPVGKPGFTWTPGGPESVKREVHDRIDWVLSMGPATAIESAVVGEAGNENVDIGIPQWPSDHRSVVSTFTVRAAPTPEFVSVASRALEQGEELTARYYGDEAGEALVVRPAAGGDPVAEVDPSEGPGFGELSASTDSMEPREYDVALVDDQGQDVASTTFYLYAPGTEASITTAKKVYKVGEPIEVSWAKAPGMKWDWIGVFKAGDGAKNDAVECPTGYCGNGNYLLYGYTHSEIEGSVNLDDGSSGPWPLAPGSYDVRLLVDDGYTRAAISKPFEIVKP